MKEELVNNPDAVRKKLATLIVQSER